jgi:hypothetical protein
MSITTAVIQMASGSVPGVIPQIVVLDGNTVTYLDAMEVGIKELTVPFPDCFRLLHRQIYIHLVAPQDTLDVLDYQCITR